MVTFMLEAFLFLLSLIKDFWFEIVVCVAFIVFAVFTFRMVVAVFCRYVFLLKLKTALNKNKNEFKIYRSVLASLLFCSCKLDMEIKTENNSFNIFFCPGYIKRKNVYVFNETKIFYSRVRGTSFWGNRNWGGAPSYISAVEQDKKCVDLALNNMGQGQNILLFGPKPIDLYVFKGNGYVKSGSGDMTGNLLIYESQDFINFINRKNLGA